MKKLLKYDLKSVFRFWWIGALATVILSFVGAFCIRILNSERAIPVEVLALSGIGIFICILGIIAFSVLLAVVVFVRFYRNFFTDEGYLTFTLPVKRSDLINAKLLTALITTVSGGFILFLNVLLLVFVSGSVSIAELKPVLDAFANAIAEAWEQLGICFPILVLEVIATLLLCTFFTILLLFCCITFAAVVCKRAKVVAAIGIYYLVNSIVSYVVQVFTFFGIPGLDHWLSGVWGLPIENYVVVLILLGIILFISIVCALLYLLQYWMLDRKLNLS